MENRQTLLENKANLERDLESCQNTIQTVQKSISYIQEAIAAVDKQLSKLPTYKVTGLPTEARYSGTASNLSVNHTPIASLCVEADRSFCKPGSDELQHLIDNGKAFPVFYLMPSSGKWYTSRGEKISSSFIYFRPNSDFNQ